MFVPFDAKTTHGSLESQTVYLSPLLSFATITAKGSTIVFDG